eukprot:3717240-Pyramimonas_sp.AAC.1
MHSYIHAKEVLQNASGGHEKGLCADGARPLCGVCAFAEAAKAAAEPFSRISYAEALGFHRP